RLRTTTVPPAEDKHGRRGNNPDATRVLIRRPFDPGHLVILSGSRQCFSFRSHRIFRFTA
ncbi:MAG TPA: hypothetical protein VKM36_06715, partial [Balneolaceae bacterium]|nr:hypothetical protein [Balneolaceae bacterium]